MRWGGGEDASVPGGEADEASALKMRNESGFHTQRGLAQRERRPRRASLCARAASNAVAEVDQAQRKGSAQRNGLHASQTEGPWPDHSRHRPASSFVKGEILR